MKVVAVSISKTKGVKKENVGRVLVRPDHGVEGDAHAGNWHRQVSMLALESIEKMQAMGVSVGPGDFAENITTRELDLTAMEVGARLRVGPAAVLELTQIGKKCHTKCAIYHQVGQCVMPTEGVFFKVIEPGVIQAGDDIVPV